eukprot:scaffold85042_cov49-Phaeocystis_antarctica.AAC.1
MVSDSRVRAAALPPPSAPPSCAGQPRAMPWQASSRRTVKSTMASRVASPCEGVKRNGGQLDHVDSAELSARPARPADRTISSLRGRR